MFEIYIFNVIRDKKCELSNKCIVWRLPRSIPHTACLHFMDGQTEKKNVNQDSRES